MAKKPDVPCAGGCGRLLWEGRGSLPQGRRCCRQCRQLGRAPFPVQSPAPREVRACSHPECDRKHLALGLCAHHYGKARRERGLDASCNPQFPVTVEASLHGAYFPKLKTTLARRTVGLMIACPACRSWMSAPAALDRVCMSCATTARLVA